MTELSPQAQAVLDAAFSAYRSAEQEAPNDEGMIAAAALRAVVEQLGYSNVPEEFAHLRPLVINSDDLLAIAAELDGGTTTPTES
jgi:hypothetical protein